MASILALGGALAADLEALLLPAACLSCGRALPAPDEGACAVCRTRLRPLGAPACVRCGQPLDPWEVRRPGGAGCGCCAAWPASLAWARSAVWLDAGPARDLVHGLKYDGWRVAARPMAEAMRRLGGPRLTGAAALVPVPLGPRRLRRRGHNQAAVLAEALGARLGVAVVPCLRRERETRTQTALGPADRWRNVAGAFAVAGRVPGPDVVLVDDVLTTGATLAACAATLASAGAVRIGAVTFARAAVPD